MDEVDRPQRNPDNPVILSNLHLQPVSRRAPMDKVMMINSRLDQLYSLASPCRLCPRKCGARRLKGELGICQSPWGIKVAAALPHFGEEPPLIGSGGSGTIFFSHCHLQCRHCQNYQISHLGGGSLVDISVLENLFLSLQERGCHNVNLVTPTHFLPFIVHGLAGAIQRGFDLPIVYNSGGYERVETISLLEGIVDIYLPDMKFGDNQKGAYVSRLDDYVEHCRRTLREMNRQVGPLLVDEAGIACRGLIVRHLVLPHELADTRQALRIIMEETGSETSVALMGQYFPAASLRHDPLLGRSITADEWDQALKWLDLFEVRAGWIQEPCPDIDLFIPDFHKQNVFSYMTLKGLETCQIT